MVKVCLPKSSLTSTVVPTLMTSAFAPLFDDHMVAHHVLDDEDATFEHSLLVLRLVVLGVLRDVTEVLGVLDALGHLGATYRAQLFQLALQLDETVLREQHRLVHSVPCNSKAREMPSGIRSLEPGV